MVSAERSRLATNPDTAMRRLSVLNIRPPLLGAGPVAGREAVHRGLAHVLHDLAVAQLDTRLAWLARRARG